MRIKLLVDEIHTVKKEVYVYIPDQQEKKRG